jgi:hypothetical protein
MVDEAAEELGLRLDVWHRTEVERLGEWNGDHGHRYLPWRGWWLRF